MLITIEGLDGTGKSTLTKELRSKMAQDTNFSRWIYQTKEPGLQTFLGQVEFNRPGIDIRNIVLNDSSLIAVERELLFYIDASQHRRFIENQGKDTIVLSDRGLWSHLAYLRATMKTKQMGYELYQVLKNVISSVCAIPDHIIYLQGDLELMKSRNKNKLKDVIESNGDSFFQYVLETYESLALSAKNCLILKASNSTSANVEAVLSYLHEQLKSGHL